MELEKENISFTLKSATEYSDPWGLDEVEDISILNMAQLVTMIQELRKDVLSTAPYGFDNAVEQLKILNLGIQLKIEGMHFSKSVKDGEMITPDGF